MKIINVKKTVLSVLVISLLISINLFMPINNIDGNVNIFNTAYSVANNTYTTVYNTDEAEYLGEIGILKGTDKGFELGKPLSRVDGSVMLVRLLGDEQLAQKKRDFHPFTDVPEWADDYVGYLFANELTKGVSRDKFAANELMTADQYATFILRALGYNDSNGDFAWDKAVEKLVQLNVINDTEADRSLTKDFLRDDMVLFSHNSLLANIKGSKDKLIDKLIAKGAVSADKDINNIKINSFSVDGIQIGDNINKVTAKYGIPHRRDASQYDFEWYIYNRNYEKYLQVGVKNNKVVAIHSNSLPWTAKGLGEINKRSQIRQKLGLALEGVTINDIRYLENINSSKVRDIYLIDNKYYVYFYYDTIDGNTIESIMLLDKTSRESLRGFHTKGNEKIRQAFERQIFDITNAGRAKRGLDTFTWQDNIANVARAHSKDMAEKGYFHHNNLDGETPFDRMKKGGIRYKLAAENIAAGGEDAIMTYILWMNSQGHRDAILSDQKYLGVGVHFGGEFGIYYTQNFYTP